MRFLMIPKPASGTQPPVQEAAFDEQLFTAYMKYNEAMHVAGVLVASEGLQPGQSGAHVSIQGGKRTVVDGPYAETKELVAGFWLIDVASKAEAIEWALCCPINPAFDEVIELRQLTGVTDIPRELVELCIAAAPKWSETWSKARP